MATAPTPKLVCAQCGFENEPERVYCHNCGTKLDRSVLPRETVTQQEAFVETRKRIRKMTSPGQVKAVVRTFVSTLVWAVVVSSLYLLLMPPPSLPAKQDEMNANIISGEIEAAVLAPHSISLQATGGDISQHVKTRVKGVSIIPGAESKRTFASIGDGTITFGTEQRLFGFPFYSTITYRPTVVDGALKVEKVAMHINRLGFPPQFAEMTGLDSGFDKFWTALKEEAKLVHKAKSITITKDRAIVVTKP